eukprot:9048301-Pyramimonas_sp.AAC.1
MNLQSARAGKLFVPCYFFGHNIWSGSSTSPPAVRKVDGLPPAPSSYSGVRFSFPVVSYGAHA